MDQEQPQRAGAGREAARHLHLPALAEVLVLRVRLCLAILVRNLMKYPVMAKIGMCQLSLATLMTGNLLIQVLQLDVRALVGPASAISPKKQATVGHFL